jgi:ribosome-binding factor A
MKGLRNERLAKQIQKDLSDIFLHINRDNFRGKMLSVSEVRLTKDLSIAKVYLSIFPSENSEKILDEITAMTSQIRFELGNKIRHQVRKIPELRFYLDTTFDEIEKIDKLLKNDNFENDENND